MIVYACVKLEDIDLPNYYTLHLKHLLGVDGSILNLDTHTCADIHAVLV